MRRERFGVARRCGLAIVQRPSNWAETGLTELPRPGEMGQTLMPSRGDAGESDMVAMCLRRRCLCAASVGSAALLRYLMAVVLSPAHDILTSASVSSTSQ